MDMHGPQEIEVKFYLNDPAALERRLQEAGASLVQPRLHEINLRYDTSDGRLTREARVLRLRQDTAARLTYKGPGSVEGGVRIRQEIEVVVEDFDTTRMLLEALGYQLSMMYEKNRLTYDLDGLLVTLDEMPYGNFMEIEGPNPAAIQTAARRLGLDWEAGIPESYSVLFERLKVNLNLTFRDLSFANFAGLAVTPAALGVRPADQG